jgi:hypothetical protein
VHGDDVDDDAGHGRNEPRRQLIPDPWCPGDGDRYRRDGTRR